MRKIIKCLISIILIANIHGCVVATPKSDYKMKLTNNYELWKINPNKVVIRMPDGDGGLITKTSGKVIELDYNDEYIIARSIPTYKIDGMELDNYKEKEEYIESIPEEEYEFWIIDIEKDEVYSPLNEDEFYKKRKEILVPESMELKALDTYKEDFEYVE